MSATNVRRLDPQFPVIASGQTISAPIRSDGCEYLGLALPAAFTGVALTFLVSADKVTFQPLRDATDAAISMVVAQGHSYALPAQLLSWPWFEIVSGTAEGAARTLTVVSKG